TRALATPSYASQRRRWLGRMYSPAATWDGSESLTNRLVRRAWDIGVRRPQCRRPALPQIVEIGLSRLHAIIKLGPAFIASRHQDIKRQPDAQVRAHGRVYRHQADLERVIEIRTVGDGAIEHRLAVFVLADLQIGRVLRALDEVTGRIEQKQSRPFSFDL